jgi:hypothetical protein
MNPVGMKWIVPEEGVAMPYEGSVLRWDSWRALETIEAEVTEILEQPGELTPGQMDRLLRAKHQLEQEQLKLEGEEDSRKYEDNDKIDAKTENNDEVMSCDQTELSLECDQCGYVGLRTHVTKQICGLCKIKFRDCSTFKEHLLAHL